jgi:DNA-binding NtrC family response regulator
LARHFLKRFAGRSRGVASLSEPASAKLLAYDWPGNVRELENCVERAVVMTRTNEILVQDLPEKIQLFKPVGVEVFELEVGPEGLGSLFDAERSHVLRAVREVGGNKTRAAQVLGIDRRTLHRRLRLYGMVGSS